jgi:hypothetical protein
MITGRALNDQFDDAWGLTWRAALKVLTYAAACRTQRASAITRALASRRPRPFELAGRAAMRGLCAEVDVQAAE